MHDEIRVLCNLKIKKKGPVVFVCDIGSSSRPLSLSVACRAGCRSEYSSSETVHEHSNR